MKVRIRGSASATSCRAQRSANSRLRPHSRRMSSSHSSSPTCLAYAARIRATKYRISSSYCGNFSRAAGSVTQHHSVFLCTQGMECQSQNRSSDASFVTRTSNRPLVRLAGSGSSCLTISLTSSATGRQAAPTRVGVASASWYRCSRSARSSRNVLATASSTCMLALISRPCSSHVYQVTPTPASSATSSRRSPGVRRRAPRGMPTSSGVNRARRTLRKLPSSSLRRSSTAGPCLDW
jgi:hypothetical protein